MSGPADFQSGAIVLNPRNGRMYRLSWVDNARGWARGAHVSLDAAGCWRWVLDSKPSRIKLEGCRLVGCERSTFPRPCKLEAGHAGACQLVDRYAKLCGCAPDCDKWLPCACSCHEPDLGE